MLPGRCDSLFPHTDCAWALDTEPQDQPVPISRPAGKFAMRRERDQNRIVTAMIDTHVHHWDLSKFRYPWLDDPAFDDLRKNYLPADYRADAAETAVEGWVHIQAKSIISLTQ
jgi:hypothetical protein